jgi:hypothetical protein
MKRLRLGKLSDLTNIVIASIGFFIFYTFMQVTNWIPIQYWGLWGGGKFIDAQQVLRWSDCYNTVGMQIFESYGSCSGFIYGKLLPLTLHSLSLGENNSKLIGFIFMGIISTVFGYTMSAVRLKVPRMLAIVVFLSPSMLLLVERGNFDSLIVGILFLSAIMFADRKFILPTALIAITALYKFYTLPLLLAVTFFSKTNLKRGIALMALIATSIGVLTEIRMIHSKFPSESSWKFGMSIWLRYLPENRTPTHLELFANLVGLLLFAITICGVIVVSQKMNWKPSNVSEDFDSSKNVFNLMFIAHLACFVAGMNFDYRLIFLAVATLFYINATRMPTPMQATIITSLIISLWLTYPSAGLQPIGDLSTEILTSFLLVGFFRINNLKLFGIFSKVVVK